MKKNGFIGQEFDYDRQAHQQEQLKRKQLESQLKNSQNNGKNQLTHYFTSVFGALVHMKIMRVFVDAVLRFGVPGDSKFLLGILKPDDKNFERKIMTKLSDAFAEDYLKSMGVYGEKVDAQDEDFYPYVSAILKNPEFLMDK